MYLLIDRRRIRSIWLLEIYLLVSSHELSFLHDTDPRRQASDQEAGGEW